MNITETIQAVTNLGEATRHYVNTHPSQAQSPEAEFTETVLPENLRIRTYDDGRFSLTLPNTHGGNAVYLSQEAEFDYPNPQRIADFQVKENFYHRVACQDPVLVHTQRLPQQEIWKAAEFALGIICTAQATN